jgi:hypothetical protein
MENKLEQTLMYSPRNSLTERIYSVVDLSGLSSVALYSGDSDTDFRNGKIETIFPKINGNDTLKIYIDPFKFSGIAGYQGGGESHKEYAKKMKSEGGISLGGGFSGGFSSGSGY